MENNSIAVRLCAKNVIGAWFVASQVNKEGLLVEDKISLMNRLSTFYRMSEFFFSLDRDIVRTANDSNINHVDLTSVDRKERQYKMAAEKIREICDRLKLLDENDGDSDNVSKRKELLRNKLLKLTKNIDDLT